MSSLIFDCLLERLMLYNSGRPLNLRIATGYKAFMKLIPKLSPPNVFIEVQFEFRLDSRRFENLTVPREIEG